MSAVVVKSKPMAASEAYSQPAQDRFHDTNPIGAVRGLIYADQAGTLYLEETDVEGTSWTTTATIAVAAATTTKLDWTTLTKRWYRFRHVNGATAQTNFRLIQQARGLELIDTQLTGSTVPITGAVQNVTTAGTRVQLPNIPCSEITIIAKRTNSGYVYAGGSDVSSIVYGVELSAKESYTFAVANANQIYIDTSVSGEGISYVAI